MPLRYARRALAAPFVVRGRESPSPKTFRTWEELTFSLLKDGRSLHASGKIKPHLQFQLRTGAPHIRDIPERRPIAGGAGDLNATVSDYVSYLLGDLTNWVALRGTHIVRATGRATK